MVGTAESNCLNCSAALAPPERFCSRCGQRTDTTRLTLHDLLRDLLHAFVNIERGPLAFARDLLTRPGRMAREFVAGRRRRYFGPFATLAVVVGLTTLAINAAGFELLAHDGLAATPERLMQQHFNLVLLMQLPLLGGACALLFRRERLNFCEHMVLAAYALSVRAIVIAILIPLSILGAKQHAPSPASVFIYWGAWYLYYGWTASQFYPGARFASGLRGAVAAALAHLAITALMRGADVAYRLSFPA